MVFRSTTILSTLILFVHLLNGQALSIDSTQTLTTDTTQLKDDPYGVFDMFQGNPGKAALYSLIIPSAGQIYNKQYWKVPLVLAAEGAAIYNLVDTWDTYRQWDTDWKLLVNDEMPMYTDNMDLASVKRIRDDRREKRDQAWIILIGVHVLGAADAFVSRHLIEFDVDDDITLIVDPAYNYPGVNITMNF